jgi:hypothetical protein
MIVVDANRIGTLYIQSSDSPTSVRVLKNDPDWYTPVLWQSEVGSIVTGYYRHNMILIDKAIQSTEEAQHLMMQHHRFVSSNLVFELVGTGNLLGSFQEPLFSLRIL